MDIFSEMREMVDKLNYWAKMYYEQDEPVVSDVEYDKLYYKLKAMEEEYGFSFPDSPTHRVGGAPQKKFEQSKHLQRLYSLDKAQNRDELNDWLNKLVKAEGRVPTLTAEFKFDGLTLNILYENGHLIKATTRGNGEIGEIITAQVKTIKKLPQVISYKGKIEIQGEGIMRMSAFIEYNKTASDPLKNPRNGAAGAFRNLDPEVTRSRNLSFFAYNIGYTDKTFTTQEEVRKFLIEEGFETEGIFRTVSSEKEAMEYADEVENIRESLDYPIDGIVFKVNDLSLRDEIGFTEKFPKWALAYKFKPDEISTKLLSVEWQVSRSGKLNPIAIVEPTDFGGVTVRRATLNNFDDIQKKKLRIGARVFLRRSNDVIPEITGVAEDNKESVEIEKPKKCPYCGSEVVEKGVFLYCSNNIDCAPQIINQLSHFAEKDAMDIDGLSEKTFEQLLTECNVRTVADIYRLTAVDLQGLDGFQTKKINNVLNSIEKSKNTTLDRLVYALGIGGIGRKTARDLCKKFKSLEALYSCTIEDFLTIPGIGDILASSLYEFFQKDTNRILISDLLTLGLNIEEKEEIQGVFSGMRVVLTGSLVNYKRSQAQKLIEDNGGEVAASVSKDVNLVVVGADAGSKLDKAKNLGIKTITEEDFIEMLPKTTLF